MHAYLIAKPVQRLTRRCHVVAAAKFVFMRNRVYYRIQAINVGAHAHRFFFDSGIDLRNNLDLRIDRFRVAPNLRQKIGERLNPERDPLLERWIGKISQL